MKKMNKKAFTLIELIVTIAVLGILVLLASPRFFGHTQNAELTKGFANAKSIEKASELYYMDYEDWPRLTDDPYTSEEIKSYSERIFDRTGQEVNLDTEGNYYDIDYDKLSDYIQVPDDKKNYILQNPVGKIYYMDNLNEIGIARVNYSNAKEEDDNSVEEGLMNPIKPRKPIEGEIAIDSADKLAKIGKPGEESEYPLDGDYILTANIDLSQIVNWTPIGNNNSKFTGSFNGNGYKITGLTINRSTSNVGLFGCTEGATISNVALEDINVNGGTQTGGLVGWANTSTTITNSYATGPVTGKKQVGGLVGRANISSTITNSYATGPVTGTDNVGGLVGYANTSTISNSYATGSVRATASGYSTAGGLVGSADSRANISNSYATGSVTGGDYVGGLVGGAYNRTTISNSYATGSVTGSENNVGGLVGHAGNSTISNSYATGSVTGTGSESVGGLAGRADNDITISNSYWNTETTGQTKSAGQSGLFGKTTNEMMKQATYSGWDFTNIWEITPGNYPTLR